jgi:hypothetical protein
MVKAFRNAFAHGMDGTPEGIKGEIHVSLVSRSGKKKVVIVTRSRARRYWTRLGLCSTNWVTDFCGRECSDYAGAAIPSTLTSDHPTDGKSAPRSLCLRPVDRTTLHVSVAMSGSGTFLQITPAAPSSSRHNACLSNSASAAFFSHGLKLISLYSLCESPHIADELAGKVVTLS